jgi:ribonuclease VapC
MVLDTSSLIAIFAKEPERDEFLAKIDASMRCYISASTLVEACMVIRRKRLAEGVQEMLGFIDLVGIEVIAFDEEQARIANEADHEYGKGRQNRAKLNLGDCFSYALAKHLGQPLLFKGNDFIWTDVKRA